MPTVYNKVTAGGQTLIDLSQDTVTSAAHIVSGHTGHLADGTQVAGTGGGGGGLVYETGTYTPASDVAQPTINFANSHNSLPILIMFEDATGTYISTTNSNYLFAFLNYYGLTGEPTYPGSTSLRYATVRHEYRGTSATSFTLGGSNISAPPDVTGSNSAYYNYWVTSTGFKPQTGSDSRYWRAGRTYKWIAVWDRG